MASSGITVNPMTTTSIINAALRKAVIIGEGQVANAAQTTTAREALNNIVAEFRVLGMSMWARKEYVITLVSGQSDYVLGVGQPINTPFPLKLYSALLEQSPFYDSKIDMNILSFMDFVLLPNTSKGVPVNVMYKPEINKGTITVWPTPDVTMPVNSRMRITYQAPFQYFISGSDTADFPEEWNNALIYQTAVSVADEFGVPLQTRQWLEKQADKHLANALSGGTEEASLFFQKDWQGDY